MRIRSSREKLSTIVKSRTPAPIEELTAHEVRGPTLINPGGHRSLHTPLATYMPLRLLGPQHQAFLALQPLETWPETGFSRVVSYTWGIKK